MVVNKFLVELSIAESPTTNCLTNYYFNKAVACAALMTSQEEKNTAIQLLTETAIKLRKQGKSGKYINQWFYNHVK